MTIMTPPSYSEIYSSKEEWDRASEMPGEAQEFEGKWVLEGQPKGEGAVLVVNRYGLRIVWGFYDEENTLHIPSHQGSPPFLSGEALAHLRELIEGVWQCPGCKHWAKGNGYCPWCGGKRDDD